MEDPPSPCEMTLISYNATMRVPPKHVSFCYDHACWDIVVEEKSLEIFSDALSASLRYVKMFVSMVQGTFVANKRVDSP